MAGIIGILMQMFFAFHWLTTSWKVKECMVSAGMSRQLQDGITAKYYTPEKKTLFFKNKYPEPALRLVWKNQKGFLIQTKFGGSARQFWGEGSPKSALVFLHHAVLSVPIKCLPEMVVVHLLSGHLFDFSPLCVFQMCPQIACHWGCKVALVAFVWLFPMCVF